MTFALWASLPLSATAEASGELSLAKVDREFTLADLRGVVAPNRYYPDRHKCPLPCGETSPSSWIAYNKYHRLARFDQPALFEFGLYSPVADPQIPTKIRACTAGSNTTATLAGNMTTTTAAPLNGTAPAYVSPARALEVSVTLELASEGLASGTDRVNSVVTALTELRAHLLGQALCGEEFMLAYHQGVVAAIYAGAAFSRSTISSVVDRVFDQLRTGAELGTTTAVQLCDAGRGRDHVFGLVVSTTNNATSVQDVLKDWADAKCVTGFEVTTDLPNVVILEAPVSWTGASVGNGTALNSTTFNFTRRAGESSPHQLQARGDCRTESVIYDDGCGTLATRCGISPSAPHLCDPNPNLCSTLMEGQRVCYSEGTLPDISPKPSEDGYCFPYTTSRAIPAPRSRGPGNGCGRLFPDMNICLSEGKPPFPNAQTGAICGPTVPDTLSPGDDTDWKDLNPCPLNACCNVWGQCGISGEFSELSESGSRSPGTSGLLNGCVSSCGSEITNNDPFSFSFGRIGYYETWNFDRPCLHQFVENAVRKDSYTIIHWAFGLIDTVNWKPVINDTFSQWEKFKKIKAKKVISFGGWGYSTEPGTYDILRQAISPANRVQFANSVYSFLNEEGLDGVDFDWEYPGATDIDGTPGGSPVDGPNYLKFLIILHGLLNPSGKTISIAAPASYWYLRNFPIEQMAGYLDCIVYMTYDLHVTKAGVRTSKIYVGESSYGRSFKMAQASCTDPQCTFLGDRLHSQAKKGRCTDTAGYISNAEIQEIISSSGTDVDTETAVNVKAWHDGDSNSDMLVYESVDLHSFTMDDYKDTKTGEWPYEDDEPLPSPLPDCTGSYTSIDAISKDNTIPVLGNTLKSSMAEYDKLIATGYDARFKTYVDAAIKGGAKAVRDWMYDHGNDYFTCDVVEEINCCGWCHYAYSGKEDGQCKYCDNKYCNGWNTSGWFNVSGPCPPDYSKRAGPQPTKGYGQSVYWHMRNDKQEEFWAKLYEGVGIKKEDIKLENYQFFVSCMPSEPEQCQYSGWDYGLPVPHGFDASDVLNPKDVVQNAYSNLTNIVKDLPTAIDQLKKGVYTGDASDLAEALILPVYMIEEAVNQIKQISDKIEEWDNEKRKNAILAFITGILFFVPIVGELVGTISTLATIGRIIAILGTLGELATDIYGVVDTKGNDPLAIFTLVLSPLAVFDAAQMAKAAKISRAMSKEEKAKLGKSVGAKIDAAKDANKACTGNARPKILTKRHSV
ncbi:glycoside hydrolase [Thozetella sp. PMI_491]|nr:glycoside hydrolase [Thozetella sp. PMI_491]